MSSRLPDLGRRGEGWVLAQFILFVAIAALGLRDLSIAGRVGSWGAAAALVGVVAIGVGLVLAVRGSLDLRAAFTPFPRPNADAPLIETGAYRLVRHPIYSGLVLAATGWSLVAGSILALLAGGLLFLLFVAKSHREEAWLVAIHPGYGAYQRRTKRLVPWIY